MAATEIAGQCRGCGAFLTLDATPVDGPGAANVHIPSREQGGRGRYLRLQPDPVVEYVPGYGERPDRLTHRPRVAAYTDTAGVAQYCAGEIALFSDFCAV